MKKILSFLLMIVFLQAQVFALSGGPTYGGGKGENIIGSYSGVLLPEANSVSELVGPNGEKIDSLGIFSLSVPITGYASGIFIVFAEGQIFPGKINAVANALKGTLNGLLEASFDKQELLIANGFPAPAVVTTTVNGTIKAKVTVVTGSGSSIGAGNNFQRVSGTAQLVFDGGQVTSVQVAQGIGNGAPDTSNDTVNNSGSRKISKVLNYTVDGVKQSNSATTDTGAGTGATTGF